jgi:eukaryotic-like serine/threonine-protein kinase
MDVGTRVLADRYELLAPLARGGMGQVWRARDRLLGRPVAVKILRSEFTDDPGFRARFRSEAQHAAVMVHPNIASVFDYGEVAAPGTQETVAYLVMELVDGESLAHLLRREGRLSPELTLSIVRQTAAALAAAHGAGIVHRDIKPGNVLVAPDGTVKITDFGVAWSAASVPLTRTGQVIGTAHYLSPEQAQGDKATPASDVYALGAVAYECLAGRRLFDGESSVQIVLRQIRDEPDPLPADVPPDLRELVLRALAKDPAVRYADGAALQAAAERVTLTGASPTGTAVLDLPLGSLATAPVPVASGMPPLRGPRTAEQTVVAPAPSVEERRPGNRAGLWVLVGALLAVVGVVAGLTLLGDAGNPAPQTPAAPSPTTSASPSPSRTSSSAPAPPSTVVVAARDYVGRPIEEVRTALTSLGLQVAIEPLTTADVPEGTVTSVDPAGEVALADAVTLTYAVAPAAPPPADGGDKKPGKGKGKDKKD